MHDGTQPVGDEDGDVAALCRYVADGGCDLFFGQTIEGTGGFVEDEQGRFAQQGTGDGQSLFSPPDSFSPPSPIMVSRPFLLSATASYNWLC